MASSVALSQEWASANTVTVTYDTDVDITLTLLQEDGSTSLDLTSWGTITVAIEPETGSADTTTLTTSDALEVTDAAGGVVSGTIPDTAECMSNLGQYRCYAEGINASGEEKSLGKFWLVVERDV